MAPSQGQCAKCNQPNAYNKIVCDFCGARLPWANAVQSSTRQSAPQQTAPRPASAPQASSWSSLPRASRFLIVFFALMGVPFLAHLVTGSRTGIITLSPLHITRAKYDSLNFGDSYSTAVSLMGEPGEKLSESKVMNIDTVMYGWKNSDGSNMNAMFQNDRLINKAQLSLP